MLKRLLICPTFENTYLSELAMTALRVFMGCSFAFAHGLAKFPVNEQLIGGVAALGFPMPTAFAWMAALAELLGGVLLILGLFTRFGALMLAITMTVAAFGAHASDPFQTKELALVFLFVALVFATKGAGRYSLDRLISKAR